MNTGKRSIPGEAIAILEIVTIEIPVTAAVVELTPIFSPASVVNGIPTKVPFIEYEYKMVFLVHFSS